ncbi:MAG: hypothetical protein R3C56_29850 [Pirellulaceae bacterium]
MPKKLSVDTDRVYVLGHSMGAPELGMPFGRARAICRYPKPRADCCREATFAKFKDVPIWAFHGGSDPVAPTDFSREIFARLKEVKGNLKYTELRDVQHGAAQFAFNYQGDQPEKGFVTQYSSHRCDMTDNVWDWLFRQELAHR